MARRKKRTSEDVVILIIIGMVVALSLIYQAINAVSEFYNGLTTYEKMFGYSVISIFIFLIYKFGFAKGSDRLFYRRYPFTHKNIEQINAMSPTEAEHYVAGLLQKRGFTKVRVTQQTGDSGVDIFAYDPHGRKVVVEVKNYQPKSSIGRRFIQILDSAKGHFKADYAIFVTTSYYTNTAKAYAVGKNIQLVDGKELSSWINNT